MKMMDIPVDLCLAVLPEWPGLALMIYHCRKIPVFFFAITRLVHAQPENVFTARISLSHRLHTPGISNDARPIRNDHPYSSMGYLGLGVSRFRENDFSA